MRRSWGTRGFSRPPESPFLRSLRYFSIATAHTGGTHRVEVLDLLANDLHVVGLVRALGLRGDKSLDMTVVHIWRLSDGKPAQVSIIPTDQ